MSFIDSDLNRAVRRASVALWWGILPVSLVGVFLAELFVMIVLWRIGLPWGLATSLLDAALLAFLVLPGVYLVVLRLMGRLTASLAVASADARFRAVVEATSDGIIVGDSSGRIRYANPAALQMLGYAVGELEGSEVALLVPEDLRPRYLEAMRRYLETGEARVVGRGAVEMDARARSGERIPVELTLGAPTLWEEGLLVAVLRDVRQRRKLGLFEALLPVCCVCGRIRDDDGADRGQGRWGSLEDYVQRRASARLSHTFCPECVVGYRRGQGLAPAASTGK